jgi:hypothetical protein
LADGVRIQLCGPLAFEIDGRRIDRDLPGHQGRLLFAYLVLHRLRPVRRDELIDALWPDHRPRPVPRFVRCSPSFAAFCPRASSLAAASCGSRCRRMRT